MSPLNDFIFSVVDALYIILAVRLSRDLLSIGGCEKLWRLYNTKSITQNQQSFRVF